MINLDYGNPNSFTILNTDSILNINNVVFKLALLACFVVSWLVDFEQQLLFL